MSENQSPTTPTYDSFVRKLFNRSGDPSKDFTHAVLGIVTEIHEFRNATDEVNALEELGDLRFYVQALRQVVLDVEGPHEIPDINAGLQALVDLSAKMGMTKAVAHACNELLDIAKRWVGYGKAPKSLAEVLHTCANLVLFVNMTSQNGCQDSLRIEASNMAKLLKRYPGGEFSQYHALVRDLGAEREVLAAS